MIKRNLGASLIELMIGLAVGLGLTGALIAVYVTQSESVRQMEALSRLQENARHAFEMMGYDIRMAGSMGCATPGGTAGNFVHHPGSNWWRNTSNMLFGAEETSDSNAVGDAGFPADYSANALRGDTVMILRADHDVPAVIVGGAYDLGTGDITTTAAHGYNVGEILVLNDCKAQASVFQATSGTAAATIKHAETTPAPAAPGQGNCSATLFGTTCTTPHVATDVAGAKIMPLIGHAYYLRESPRKYSNSTIAIPSLYRQALGAAASSANSSAEELVDGIIDMQILYGEDTSGTPDGSVDTYVNAGSVTNWARVLAVRITLTLESTDNNVATTSQTFTFGNGATVTNKRLRRSYSATFGIRNRL